MGHHSSIINTRLLTVVNVSLTVSYSLTSAAAQSSSAVASLCISSGNLSSLAVGSCSGSGNSSLSGYIDNLERLDQPVGQNLAVSLILVSSNKDFDSFMQNYNMHGMGNTVNELHVMLKLHEETLPKKDANHALHAIRVGRAQKSQKNKPHKVAKGVMKDNPVKDAICYQCGEIGHWRRKCLVYLAELMKKKKISQGARTLVFSPHSYILSLVNPGFMTQVVVHGIIAHHTPPNTPQNNEVLERRNRTLLYMVRSITSQTTLPKSFWDYALEITARILNMVPTKKVEKTPYKLDAMNVEMQSIKDNDVWVLDELPPNARTIGSKWLFKKKSDIDEVYMEQPEGFVNPKYPNHVCKLKHSIYGLKQASRQWNKRFDDEIKKFGFTQNSDEPCVYLKASGSYIAILILYVDDILLMGNNIPMLQDVKSYLGRSFAIKDLGDATYILGIKIYRDRSKRLIGEAVWIRKYIFGLGIVPIIEEPISDVKIEKIDTDDNLADPITKALAFPKHSKLTRNIEWLPASSFM
uniref:Putative retrotransposon protein n=1 Tax=Tanacetum cinerariifolium TaxID=118510 RepID=A0A699GI29_TANCI|nr:putative retrotransposon protein [Tanacetum cinerariifolium]